MLMSTALGLAVVEGLARYERYHRAGGKEQRERLDYTEHDPLLGWRKTPGARVTYHRRDFTTEVRINSHGLHDRERTYSAAPGTRRVLVLGDSFVEAYQVDFEDSLTQRLERSLGRRCPAEVINAGSAGYGTDQEYLYYTDQGVRYGAQVVVLFAYYNDVLYNVREQQAAGIRKPLLSLEGERPEVSNFPVPRREPPVRGAPRPVVIEGSAALTWVGERLERSRPHLYNQLAGLGLFAPTRRLHVSEQLLVYKKKPTAASRPAWRVSSEEAELAWQATDKIFAALAAEVAANGARFLVAYIPSRMEVRDSDWALTVLRYGLNEERWDRWRVARELTHIGRRHGFPVLDLTKVLRAATRPWRWPYHEHDGHWNALGHEIAAREVETFLQREGWLDGC